MSVVPPTGAGASDPPRPEEVAHARAVLATIPGWERAAPRVSLLTGGITNRNYLLEREDGERFVLRLGGARTELLGIDRDREYAAATMAAAQGVGPEVVFYLPAVQALLCRYVDGDPLTPAAAADPATLREIARTLRRCHEAPAIPGRFSVWESVRAYVETARAHGVTLPAELGDAIARAATFERALGPPARAVPCHNDLLAANFIRARGAIFILDWEYAAMGDPFFDLGNFAANQELDDRGCELLLAAYRGTADDRDRARLEILRVASDLRESTWGFLQCGISRLDFDFRGYAAKHLARFLARARAGDTGRALRVLAGRG